MKLPWTYLDGSPQERQEVATHGQQDKHAVEVEAGGRSSGPGQSMLITKTKSVKTWCKDPLKSNKIRTFAGIPPLPPSKWQQMIWATH